MEINNKVYALCVVIHCNMYYYCISLIKNQEVS